MQDCEVACSSVSHMQAKARIKAGHQVSYTRPRGLWAEDLGRYQSHRRYPGCAVSSKLTSPGSSCQSRSEDPALSLLWTWVQSLVRE